MKLSGPAVHSHGVKQPEESEHVVSVYVGDEYRLNLDKRQMGAPHLLLTAFSAINEKQAPSCRKHLGAWISIGNGHSRSCAHYSKSKVHKDYSPFSSFSLRAARASMSPRVVFSTLVLTFLITFLVFSASAATAFSLTSA